MNLQTLGGLALAGTTFTQPKPLVLLSYLSLEGSQPRKHLAELFWREGNRMKSLSMTLTRLRQGAGDVIEADAKKTWVKVKSDAALLLESLDKSEWEQAVTLYTGAFLEGVILEDWGSELEEWVYKARQYLAERVQYALLNLAEDAARAQDFDKAGDLAERAYNLPGLASQDLAGLKRLYPLLSASNSPLLPNVRKELETYGVAVQLGHEAAKAAFQNRVETLRLPTRQTSFIGRDVELTELATMLEQGQLLTVLGVAGTGKTRLALQFAHEQQKLAVYESVYFVALESREHLFETVLSTLGVKQGTATEPLTALTTFIHERSVLLILDNLEHLARYTEGVSHLLQDCPNLKLLVTSRERLGLEEEHLFLLEGLAFPGPNTPLEEALTFDALTLFRERAQQLQPQFDLAQQLESVLTICKLVEGLPLGLELAASWVRLMSCLDIAQEIQRNFDFLTTTTRNVPERHRSLRAAFEYSWSLLNAKERAVLCKLSVFQGGFRREAASRVAGATLPLLASLADKSLLRVSADGRYDQHPLIYQYAREKALEHEHYTTAELEHSRYYLTLGQTHQKALYEGKQENVLHDVREEWANIRAVMERSVAGRELETLQQWLTLVDTYFDSRGAHQEGLEFLTRAQGNLKVTVAAERILFNRISAERAWYHFRLGDYVPAKTVAQETLQQTGEGEEHSSIHALNTLGLVERRTGEAEASRSYFEKALGLARRSGNDIHLVKTLANLAATLQVQGQNDKAEHYFLETLALYRKLGMVVGLVRELNNLGWFYYTQKELAKAKPLLEEGLVLARSVDSKQNLPYLLNNLGYLAFDEGNYRRSLELNTEALGLAKGTGERAVQAEILAALARNATGLGLLEEALSYAQQALQLAHAVGYTAVLLQAMLARAELSIKRGDSLHASQLCYSVLEHPSATTQERGLAQNLLGQLQLKLERTNLRISFQDLLGNLLGQEWVGT
jgi:predicted ATPase/Tfp pilus assembly protein PilF